MCSSDLEAVVDSIISSFGSILGKLSSSEVARMRKGSSIKKNVDNHYLGSCISELGYIEGINYTVGVKNSPFSIYLNEGILLLSVAMGTKQASKLDKLYKDLKFNKSEVKGKAILYTYDMTSRRELDNVIKKIMLNDLNQNIFIG